MLPSSCLGLRVSEPDLKYIFICVVVVSYHMFLVMVVSSSLLFRWWMFLLGRPFSLITARFCCFRQRHCSLSLPIADVSTSCTTFYLGQLGSSVIIYNGWLQRRCQDRNVLLEHKLCVMFVLHTWYYNITWNSVQNKIEFVKFMHLYYLSLFIYFEGKPHGTLFNRW
jgi:hypothetical protein